MPLAALETEGQYEMSKMLISGKHVLSNIYMWFLSIPCQQFIT